MYCRRKFEVKLPTIVTDEKQSRAEEEKDEKRRETEKRKSQKKEDSDARKSRKAEKHCVFPEGLWLRRVEK